MKKDGIYRTVVFGPTGAGKSQFCNFSLKDLNNNTNKVSDSLNSCTSKPQSNIFTRCGINIELIDTAGSNDTENRDLENLENVCAFLRPKKQIDYIILLLNYEERLQKNTRDYIEILGNIFTPIEFYTHLCVVFTHLPEKINKKVNQKKAQIKEEVYNIINKIFGIDENQNLHKIQVYFLNTEVDEDDDGNKKFDKTSQATVDVIYKQMIIDTNKFPPISTKDIEASGKNKILREEEQKKKIKELEEIIRQDEIRKKKEEEEIKRLKKEIEDKKRSEQERKKKEQELKEIQRKQEEERKRLEQIKKEAQKIEEENKKREEAIKQICKENKIDVQTLNNVIDFGGGFAAGGGIGAGIGLLLTLGGAALTCVCPVLGPAVMSFGIGATVGGGADVAIGGAIAGVSKIIKETQ